MATKKAKRAPRSRWTTPVTPIPAPEPEDVRLKKAKRLPMFGPGIVITVPLSLLPEYMKLYQLRPMSAREVQDWVNQKMDKSRPAGVLLVKREPKGAPHADPN